ncbi:hypothetical protein LJR234_004045 [Mesorhizobium amorphae]|uniref:hypothetical protein n=1 Tax=Mesorhizobium amorphae TaxID=71433 RepID=UPI003ECFC45E
MSEKELQEEIARQMKADFRADPRMAYEKYGLTASLHRGVVRCVVAFGVLLAAFLIWTTIHH